MSASIACPNCGAPANVAPGATTAMCTFCARSFSVAAPQPPAPPPPAASPYSPGGPYGGSPQPPPRMIVVVPPGGGGSYDPTAAAISTAGWAGFRLVMALIPVIIIAMVGGITWFTSRGVGATANLGGMGGWTGMSPLVCGGNDEINASGVSSNTGITAGGNCHVTCTGCTISAPVGVSAGGNAQVDLVDCHITGTSGEAIVASGNAQVRMVGSGSTLSGTVVHSGNATIVAPTPPAAAVPPPKPTSGPSPAAPTHAPSSRR